MIQEQLRKLGAEYFNITEKEFLKRTVTLQPQILKDWNDKKNIIDFYETTNIYIYDLINFNDEFRLDNLLHPLKYFKDLNILDYGAGIGIVSSILANRNNVYYYDVDGKTKDFAKFLNMKLSSTFEIVDTEKEAFDVDVNCIVCVDVLEHLEKPMELVKKITEKLKSQGLFLTTGLNFSVGEHIPMHLKKNIEYVEEYNTYMNEHYQLSFLHSTKNETVFLWVKK